jgi:hypothetical protein
MVLAEASSQITIKQISMIENGSAGKPEQGQPTGKVHLVANGSNSERVRPIDRVPTARRMSVRLVDDGTNGTEQAEIDALKTAATS